MDKLISFARNAVNQFLTLSNIYVPSRYININIGRGKDKAKREGIIRKINRF